MVGLTGGIASGKSTVSFMFRELGACLIDADELARKAISPGSPGYNEVVETFGEEYILATGKLDRRALGRLVFRDPRAKKRLEAIIHPWVWEERGRMLEKIEKMDPHAVVFLDIPLLIEGRLTQGLYAVVLVYVPEHLQMLRLIRRDGLTPKEAIMRMRNQMPLDEKLFYADLVIDNGVTIENTRRQVGEVWNLLV